MAIAIVVGFVHCWAPRSVIKLLILFAWESDRTLPCGIYLYHNFAFFISLLSCAINPFICLTFSENYRQGLTVQRIQQGPPNVFLPITRRVQNKRIGVAVAFGPITIGVQFYFWFERKSMRRATRMCTSTLMHRSIRKFNIPPGQPPGHLNF